VSPLAYIPALTFILLLAGEWLAPRRETNAKHGIWDWIIHLSGFLVQGAIIPLCSYGIATRLLPRLVPSGAGVLPLGWCGAFLLNFVFVDFLYYWQHRAMHHIPWFWKLHLCHHTAERVDVWVTSRNTLVFHFFFVYFLINPILGYLVTEPEGFFAGAMLTASLDIFRHANIDASKIPGTRRITMWADKLLVLPGAHHRHHGAEGYEGYEGNYGANLIIWDRMFGTLLPDEGYPASYGVRQAPTLPVQWLFPFNAPWRDSNAPEP
jgi:sterol desaturase/sphingolipid hydroxylase (fatty acid hydroxylase superfamily)